jgi:hypothetical protein
MSLTRDPAAASSIKIDDSAIDPDPEVQHLETQYLQLRKDLVGAYG